MIVNVHVGGGQITFYVEDQADFKRLQKIFGRNGNNYNFRYTDGSGQIGYDPKKRIFTVKVKEGRTLFYEDIQELGDILKQDGLLSEDNHRILCSQAAEMCPAARSAFYGDEGNVRIELYDSGTISSGGDGLQIKFHTNTILMLGAGGRERIHAESAAPQTGVKVDVATKYGAPRPAAISHAESAAPQTGVKVDVATKYGAPLPVTNHDPRVTAATKQISAGLAVLYDVDSIYSIENPAIPDASAGVHVSSEGITLGAISDDKKAVEIVARGLTNNGLLDAGGQGKFVEEARNLRIKAIARKPLISLATTASLYDPTEARKLGPVVEALAHLSQRGNFDGLSSQQLEIIKSHGPHYRATGNSLSLDMRIPYPVAEELKLLALNYEYEITLAEKRVIVRADALYQRRSTQVSDNFTSGAAVPLKPGNSTSPATILKSIVQEPIAKITTPHTARWNAVGSGAGLSLGLWGAYNKNTTTYQTDTDIGRHEEGRKQAKYARTSLGMDAGAIAADGAALGMEYYNARVSVINGAATAPSNVTTAIAQSSDEIAAAIENAAINTIDDVARTAGIAAKIGTASKILGPVGLAVSVGAGYYEYRTSDEAGDGYRAAGAVGGTAGGIIGGILSGMGTGAVTGSIVPGWGTIIGGIVGGIAGGFGGAWAGDKIARNYVGDDWQAEYDAKAMAKREENAKRLEVILTKVQKNEAAIIAYNESLQDVYTTLQGKNSAAVSKVLVGLGHAAQELGNVAALTKEESKELETLRASMYVDLQRQQTLQLPEDDQKALARRKEAATNLSQAITTLDAYQTFNNTNPA